MSKRDTGEPSANARADDSDIYLQTSYALYKLKQPSVHYRPMYFKFWAGWQIMTYLDRLVLIHPQSTSEDFIAELRARHDVAARGTRLGYEQNRIARHVVSWQDLADRVSQLRASTTADRQAPQHTVTH